MKSSADPRHLKRIYLVKQLFAESFAHRPIEDPDISAIVDKLEIIDEKIQKAATSWPIDKLNKIDLAILRLAVFEMENKNAPPKVVIDEAVEIAKKFGGENSPSFINGVLGTILKEMEDKENGQE